MGNKRQRGQYYTRRNPFAHEAFRVWARIAGLPSASVLEPFAGANYIIEHLREARLCEESASFDIDPAAEGVVCRDTLSDFPRGFDVCVTNPPWLAKNSARRRGIPFPETAHDDIYKLALERCLEHCGHVAALIPESFIRSRLFRDRLWGFISIRDGLFDDTGHPTGLAMFLPNKTRSTMVWAGEKKLDYLWKIEQNRPKPCKSGRKVKFNVPEGNVGLRAIDNTRVASIRFCHPKELGSYEVRGTCRSITKLRVEGAVEIERWNNKLEEFRQLTHDVLMTAFKGIRADGMYRRRMDWDLARGIIQDA